MYTLSAEFNLGLHFHSVPLIATNARIFLLFVLMMKAVILRIDGLVQGVFFRKHTREKAIELGLCGTVLNCSDGSVEVIAEGAEQALSDFVQWCHHGPPRAKVLKVDIHETTLKNFHDFVILRE